MQLCVFAMSRKPSQAAVSAGRAAAGTRTYNAIEECACIIKNSGSVAILGCQHLRTKAVARIGEESMKRSNIAGQRLVAVFLLGCVLFNYPVLFLFDTVASIFGIPALYAYIFGAWSVLIALMAYTAEYEAD